MLAEDDGDVFLTLDSDSILDRHAVREGLAPFADPQVQSVAGHVLVLNRTANLLTRMTCVLYLPFTRGLRSAQSVLRRVTINSGTLAFYRANVVRRCAGAYENEHFRGRPMQMNDDSMLTSLLTFALAPLASLWRLLVLRPMYLYALLTCWRVNRWGTRGGVEVSLTTAAV
ncbi:glycosyltransferase family 2 protein [Nonomuraea candida]|uniref:glycosyltransferase family 2 protein n=1 Tax=Nonomuraea candida TaxID=359159 RepID=UPI0006933429|nr:glycosyltransferase family 2 protein [Nonomuraea candida]